MSDQLHGLWEQYLSAPARVPVDHWLSARLRRAEGMRRAGRLWVGERILDACRFAAWVLFCESLLAEREAGADRPRRSGSDFPEAIRRFREEYGGDGGGETAAVAALRLIPAADFFFWMAKREALQRDKRAAPPPRWEAEHSSREAAILWDRIADFFAAAADPEALLLWSGLGPWLWPFVLQRSRAAGWDEAERKLFIRRHAFSSPLWLRLNRETEAETVNAELTAKQMHPVRRPPAAVRVSGPEGIQRLDCWRTGKVEIQDWASQQIGLALDSRPGMFVWDCCAGGGGKTLQLASLLGGKGGVYASDADARKLEILRLRARRAGLSGAVRILPWQGEGLPPFPREIASRGGFDRVLVDAPCSGSGTWRRNPDGRLFFHAERLEALQERQARLLAAASAAVRRGGLLIYATCSIVEGENEGIGTRFTASAAAAGFRLLSMELFGNPLEDSDTTFAAIFQRG